METTGKLCCKRYYGSSALASSSLSISKCLTTRFFSCLRFGFTLFLVHTALDIVNHTHHHGYSWLNSVSQINQLKRTWNQGQNVDIEYSLPSAFSHTVDGSSLLFNEVKPLEHAEVLSTLPPKGKVDKLVSSFFDRDRFPISVPRKSLISCRDASRSWMISYSP